MLGELALEVGRLGGDGGRVVRVDLVRVRDRDRVRVRVRVRVGVGIRAAVRVRVGWELGLRAGASA